MIKRLSQDFNCSAAPRNEPDKRKYIHGPKRFKGNWLPSQLRWCCCKILKMRKKLVPTPYFAYPNKLWSNGIFCINVVTTLHPLGSRQSDYIVTFIYQSKQNAVLKHCKIQIILGSCSGIALDLCKVILLQPMNLLCKARWSPILFLIEMPTQWKIRWKDSLL